jgi:hypothetical protein
MLFALENPLSIDFKKYVDTHSGEQEKLTKIRKYIFDYRCMKLVYNKIFGFSEYQKRLITENKELLFAGRE